MCLNQWTMFVIKKFEIVSWVLIFLFFKIEQKEISSMIWRFFAYLKFRSYSFVFSNLSSYSVFLHFCFFFKENAFISNQQNIIVNFVLEFIRDCLIVMLLFKILLLMSKILLLSLISFLKKLHFFLLMFALIMHFFIDEKKAKIFKCTYF